MIGKLKQMRFSNCAHIAEIKQRTNSIYDHILDHFQITQKFSYGAENDKILKTKLLEKVDAFAPIFREYELNYEHETKYKSTMRQRSQEAFRQRVSDFADGKSYNAEMGTEEAKENAHLREAYSLLNLIQKPESRDVAGWRKNILILKQNMPRRPSKDRRSNFISGV